MRQVSPGFPEDEFEPRVAVPANPECDDHHIGEVGHGGHSSEWADAGL